MGLGENDCRESLYLSRQLLEAWTARGQLALLGLQRLKLLERAQHPIGGKTQFAFKFHGFLAQPSAPAPQPIGREVSTGHATDGSRGPDRLAARV